MTIEEKIVSELYARNQTLTTAESCTGGLLAGKILNVSGASAVYNEGHITYSNEAKERLLGVKQVGGICGALLTNLAAYLSGVWFDLSLVGGVFEKIAKLLPFLHGAEMEKALVRGDFEAAGAHLLPILLYGAVTVATAVLCFLRQMKKQ